MAKQREKVRPSEHTKPGSLPTQPCLEPWSKREGAKEATAIRVSLQSTLKTRLLFLSMFCLTSSSNESLLLSGCFAIIVF